MEAFLLNDFVENAYRDLKLISPSNSHLPNQASVMLASLAKIKNNSKVIELGSGIGHVLFVLAKKYFNCEFLGVEIQEDLINYSIENKKNNEIINVDFFNNDVKNIRKHFKAETFDYVISNPPHYFSGKKSTSEDRLIARNNDNLDLIDDFFSSTNFLLKNKGIFYYVVHPNHFNDIIILMRKNNLEPNEIFVGYGNPSKNAQLIFISGRKNGGKNFVVHPPIFFNE
jgi:tRNA1(Val) A37 N6-methylase TrmN6